MDLVLLHSLQA